MKQYSNTNFQLKEDVQIQISTARIAFKIVLPADVTLDQISVRGRLVSPNFGTKTIIERMPLQTLFEIAAKNEGFYRQDFRQDGTHVYTGLVDIARGGALLLNNQVYISLDVAAPLGKQIKELDIYSIQHPKTTTTYLHYNPVSINQVLQNVQLDRAVEVVMPISEIGEIQMSYPDNTVSHVNAELRILADMMNDLVLVRSTGVEGTRPAEFGYLNHVIFPVRDELSGQTATRLQVESLRGEPRYTIYLIEEKTL